MTIKSATMHLSFYAILIGIIFLLSVCRSVVATKPAFAGLVATNIFFYDTAVRKFIYASTYWPEGNIWYKDSFVVEKLTGIEMEQDEQGIFQRRAVINGYVFIDLRTKSFYEYTSFSDTAKLQKKYTQPDSSDIVGGWNFYYPKPIIAESYTPLADTTIDEIGYKRFRLGNMWHTIDRSGISYLRCDKKGSFFQYGRELGEKLGCPIVRLDDIAVKKGQTLSSRRIDFLRDSLTPEELKVFAAWEKNAKENPIPKN